MIKITEKHYKNVSENKKTRVSELIKHDLEHKWGRHKENQKKILELSAFCTDNFLFGKTCQNCICPKLLCNDGGEKGLMGFFLEKYGNCKIEHINKSDYDFFIQILKMIKNEGELNMKMKILINKYTSNY